ncbi:MAG: carbohydrate binding family 9 domain-containing protein, partial [Burkholderiaceae bacterium]|nr:carbohydrate binding family 9 domain-containing protein [Burkholderiaceae bacterium]
MCRIVCRTVGRAALLLVLVHVLAAPCAAHATLPPLTAVAADAAIRLDARLDEPVWERAPAYEQFQQQDPFTGGPAPYRTRVRIAYDAQALYVAVEAFDPEPAALRAPLVRYDKVFRDQDFVVVYVDGVGTRAAAQFFRVNAAGSVADGVHSAATDNEDFSPDFAWDAAARITDDGYVVEMRLPYASLRFAHHGTRPWTIQVARRMPRAQTYLFISAPLSRGDPSFIAQMQPLQGFSGPRSEASLDLLPALTARQGRSETDDGNGPTRSRRSEVDASVDLKWRPRADWVIDGTLNPDFSQIELDVPQLSRNRQFALFLQEKRPFFLEGSDLAQTPTSSLYSRSIADPRWGARATYRGDALAGTVLSVADRGGGLLLIPQPYATDAVAQPASQASTARLRWDGAALSVGALLADRSYRNDDGRARGANRVAGPDLVWRVAADQLLRAQWLAS